MKIARKILWILLFSPSAVAAQYFAPPDPGLCALFTPKMTDSEIQAMVKNDFESGRATRKRISKDTLLSKQRTAAADFAAKFKASLGASPDRLLVAMKANLTIGLAVNAVTRAHNAGPDPIPVEILDISTATLTDMRQTAIDEMRRRGISDP